MKTIGSEIKNARMVKGLNLQEGADLVGLSRMTYVRLESDQGTVVQLDTIIDVANKMGVDFLGLVIRFGKRANFLELKQCLKFAKRLTYAGFSVDKAKLENLIKENIEDIRAKEEPSQEDVYENEDVEDEEQ